MYQAGHWLAIIDIPWRKLQGQDFPPIIDDQMQLETKKPAQRGFPMRRQASEDLMRSDAAVMANG